MNKSLASRKGFSLVELLIVVGILAVLAAIAIPTVAGLINKSNQTADNANVSEINNAIVQFTSEYELYKKDLLENKINTDNLDTVQSRVYNIVQTNNIEDIKLIESEEGLDGIKLKENSNYPANYKTIKKVLTTYLKSSSEILTTQQSNHLYWYAPESGTVICAKEKSSIKQLNEHLKNNTDGNGNELTEDTVWLNISNGDIVRYGLRYEGALLTSSTNENKKFRVIYIFYGDGSSKFFAEEYNEAGEFIEVTENDSPAGTYSYSGSNIKNEGYNFGDAINGGEQIKQYDTSYGDVFLYLKDL